MKIPYKTIILFLGIILHGCHFKKYPIKQPVSNNDSISVWINLSKDTSYILSKRKLFLAKSYNALWSNKTDSLAKRLSQLAYQYLNLKDTINFKKINLEAKKLKINLKNIEHYSKFILHTAYCKRLNNDTIKGMENLYKSLNIRDSVNTIDGIVISNIHLSKYYSLIQDTLKAIDYAKEANLWSKKTKNGRGYLASLKLLTQLDHKNAKNYLNKYITYTDSLLDLELKIQNKFTRITHETNEYIGENKRLLKQKSEIQIMALALVLVLSLIYYIVIQRLKNEKLLLEAEQQKASEQIYILTLKQHIKLEEEKTKERNRISQDLHDDILGKLFGVRVNLGLLDIEGDNDTLKKRESLLKELQNIEKEIREVSHQLNTNFNCSEIDFSSILKQLLENKSHLDSFTYQLHIDNSVIWSKINEFIKVNLYRILQEALQNIIKHSKAKKVILNCSVEKGHLKVSVTDDGTGIDTKKRKEGIGIKNMKSRMKKLKGIFSIQSKMNKGTTIYLTIPIQ